MNQDLEGRVEIVSKGLRKTRAHRVFAFVTGVFFIRMGKIREEAVLIIIFILRRQIIIIIIISCSCNRSSSGILVDFYFYCLLSSCFCLTFVLFNLLENSLPLI